MRGFHSLIIFNLLQFAIVNVLQSFLCYISPIWSLYITSPLNRLNLKKSHIDDSPSYKYLLNPFIIPLVRHVSVITLAAYVFC